MCEGIAIAFSFRIWKIQASIHEHVKSKEKKANGENRTQIRKYFLFSTKFLKFDLYHENRTRIFLEFF